MWKFPLEEKNEIVLRYLEGKEDAPSIGKEYGASYSPEFKLEVLEYRFNRTASYVDIAAHFGIPSPSRIKRWIK